MNWLITLLIILFGFVIITNFTKSIIEPMKSCSASKGAAAAKVDAIDKDVDNFKKDILLKLNILTNKMDGLKNSQEKNYDGWGVNRRRLKKLTDKMQRKMNEQSKDMDKNSKGLDKIDDL